MKQYLLVSFVCFYICVVDALYEDQVGDTDWHQSYLGRVSWTSFDSVSGGRRKIILASDSGVLSAVNAASGKIAWRQELERDSLYAVAHYKSFLITVSGNTNLILRGWDMESGLIKWEVPTGLPVSLQATKRSLEARVLKHSGVALEFAGSKRDQLVLVTGDKMVLYSSRSGKELWNATLPTKGVPMVSVEDSSANIWLVGDKQITYVKYDVSKGQAPSAEEYVLTSSVISEEMDCILLANRHANSTSTPVCSFGTSVFMINVQSNKIVPLQFKDDLEISEGTRLRPAPTNYIHIGSSAFRLEDDNLLSRVCKVCRIGEVTSDKGDNVRIILHSEGDSLRIQDVLNGNEFFISNNHLRGDIEHMKVVSFHKPDGTLAWRIVAIREDASTSLLSQTGSVVWVREDALGDIVTVEMADLPSAQFEAEGFLALLDSNANPLTQAITRWKLQASLLQDLINDVLERGVASLIEPLSSEQLLRDKFNTRKVIVALTEHKKVYGLDSNDGRVLWQLFIPSLRPLLSRQSRYILYTLRTSSHPPHPPQIALIGNSAQCDSRSAIYLINPILGEVTNEGSECLSHAVSQSMLLPVFDHTHRKSIVYMDDTQAIGCYPNDCADISMDKLNLFMYIADVGTGIVKGYRVVDDSVPAVEAWQVALPSNEKILLTANKPLNDHAHSMGRVRANRDVQYKYLNPNTIGVVTKSFDQQSKSFISIYLIDSVNGGILHRSFHRLASDPVGLILCENWIVYHYFSIKSQRNEITVIETYDPRNNTESVWSSLAPPTFPALTSQSYIFPTSIVTMTTTTTLRGITPKSLLLGLPTGHILSLRKDFLDPRRELVASQQMIEEGVPPYIPDIPVTAQSYINYNQTVTRMRGIHTSATGLESTSLVFTYGLDLYMTRAQPSGQFDLLAEDFDYLLIAGVVVALTVATFVLSWLARRKTLKSLWK